MQIKTKKSLKRAIFFCLLALAPCVLGVMGFMISNFKFKIYDLEGLRLQEKRAAREGTLGGIKN